MDKTNVSWAFLYINDVIAREKQLKIGHCQWKINLIEEVKPKLGRLKTSIGNEIKGGFLKLVQDDRMEENIERVKSN